MDRPYIVGVRCGDNDTAPVIPLLICASSALAALQRFAFRSHGRIVAALEDDFGDAHLAAAVVLEEKTYAVTVRDAT